VEEVAEPRALAFILSKRLRVGGAGGAAVTSGCSGWTGCLVFAMRDSPPGCLNVDTIGFLLTETGGSLVVVLGVGVSLSRSTGFVSTGPMLMFPANEGTFFLPSESPTIFGTRRSETVFDAMIDSAVLFLISPRGPGQPSQPSCVSLKSPSQVGYGAQVPSAVQIESMSGPV